MDWYESPEGPSFSGIEAAAGVPIPNVDPDGDFNINGVLDAPDMDLLSAEASAGRNDPAYDLNSDNLVNELDRVFWINDLKKSYFGDANLDGSSTVVTWWSSSPPANTRRERQLAGRKAIGTATCFSKVATWSRHSPQAVMSLGLGKRLPRFPNPAA